MTNDRRTLNADLQWPELFDGLTEAQAWFALQALGDQWHEGWTPSRSDTALVTDLARGSIDLSEFKRRVDDESHTRPI